MILANCMKIAVLFWIDIAIVMLMSVVLPTVIVYWKCCLPWFLRGLSLRFIVTLQPAPISLQLGPHLGGTKHSRSFPLWDTSTYISHNPHNIWDDTHNVGCILMLVTVCLLHFSVCTPSNQTLAFCIKSGQCQDLQRQHGPVQRRRHVL